MAGASTLDGNLDIATTTTAEDSVAVVVGTLSEREAEDESVLDFLGIADGQDGVDSKTTITAASAVGEARRGNQDPLAFNMESHFADIDKNGDGMLSKAELMHGRVGMLAAAGFVVQEKFHPLFTGDGGPAIDQFAKLPAIMWPLITIFIGGCESLRISKGWSNPNEPDHVFQKLRPEYVPGDIGFDPLGLKPTDPEEFRIMQTKELQNGRLGMLAAAGFMAQEAVTDQTWGTYWGLPDL